MLKLDLNYAQANLEDLKTKISKAHFDLHQYCGKGNDFLGWLEYPLYFDKEEFMRVKLAATKIQKESDILVVCGIGGSYLGARMVIEAINGLKSNKSPEIIFMGNTFSQDATKQLLDYLNDKSFSVSVISKSGTTAETAIAFRLLRNLLEQQHGQNAKNYIYATTDKQRGVLKKIATKEGYETFTIDDNIGGRYSVLTSVGLLPIAVAGIDIDALMAGAKEACISYANPNLAENICYQYAATRIYLEKTKQVEVVVSYEPNLMMLGEWYKQLFGESEGKEGKGLFPASMIFSTDLHSLGQYIQDGKKLLFETILTINNPNSSLVIEETESDDDGLNYLAGKSLDYINKQAMLGTLKAHVETGNVPCIILTLDKLDPFNLGHLIYFFQKACAISGYLNNVNPFNQEGVEVYKKNMFALLKR